MPSLMPHGKQQYFDSNGNPLSGGRVYTYASGTSTPLVTYADAGGTAQNPNPVLLNARGEASIFWGPSPYKVVVKDASDVEIYTADNLQAPVGSGDLASDEAGKGASLVGFDGGTLADFFKLKAGRVVDSIADLKALDKTLFTRANTFGYHDAGDEGGGAAYWCDLTDTTSADDGVSVIVAADGGRWKLVHNGTISVRQAGAKGDGTTDDTAAFAAVIAALPGGGKVVVPTGFYRITSSLTLHSGLSFVGGNGVQMTFGTPTNDERPAHLFLDATGVPLFTNVAGVQLESVTFSDLSMGARLFPTTVTVADTTGVLLTGSNPVDAKKIVFERVTFHDFAVGVNINDPAAGAGTDWNCAPVRFEDCTWYYCDIGVRINADNADMMLFDRCAWFQNTGDIGVYALRSGTMTLEGCYGGGGIMVYFNGDARDATTFRDCQFENATAMLVVDDTLASEQTYRPITFEGCVVEADVALHSSCHFTSVASRYVNTVTADGDDIIIDSICDTFIGGGPAAFNITGTNSELRNFISTREASMVRGPIYAGQCVKPGTAAPTSGTFKVGDIVWNSSVELGAQVGWVCVVAGTPGTWAPFGQAGYRSQAGSPLGSVTPLYVGEVFFDTATSKWHKSWAMTSANWALLT